MNFVMFLQKVVLAEQGVDSPWMFLLAYNEGWEVKFF